MPSTKNKLNVKSLSPNKEYVWKVRTICADGLVSDFSPEQNFTTLPLREGELSATAVVTIYPNPASDVVYIQSDNAEIKSVTFFDMSGQLVLSTTADVSEGINTSSLTAGMYLIRIETNNEVINQQLIIHN